jgi:uncharacterized membrane protein YfcA
VPAVALTLMAANAAGGWLGAHTALRRGTAWVRAFFLAAVGAMILRLGWTLAMKAAAR